LTAAIVTASTAPVSVCVAVAPLQQSRQPGQAAQWAVAAWATGGTVPDVTIQLLAAPAGSGMASFSFGCGNSDGTPSCNLGAVNATSAQRQLQAQVSVPLTAAAAVSSVSLTAIASAAKLRTDPAASASVTVLPSPALAGITASLTPGVVAGVSAPNLTLSPGGNASGLFPTIAPQPPQTQPGSITQLADTSAPAKGTFPLGAQAAGLAVLALAFVVAITRVSVRRPAPRPAGAAAAAIRPSGAPADPPVQPEDPEDQ
jgi:hypothetical protein